MLLHEILVFVGDYMCNRIILVIALFFFVACDSRDMDILNSDVAMPEPKQIDVNKVGVNNFFNDQSFGTIDEQYREIKNVLGLNFVRVLFAWSDEVQPSASASKFVGFYDDILDSVPPDVDVLIVVAHAPTWMNDSSNWTGSDPRQMWLSEWLRPIVRRYAGHPNVIGWEVWNEPNRIAVSSDAVMGFDDPANYAELLFEAAGIIRELDPGKLVVPAATESIAEKFPINLNYNERLRDLGIQSVVDVWNIHYYGPNLEQLTVSGGVADFLNSLGMTIWITESGKVSPIGQQDYVQRIWPFLKEKVPSIDRIYFYEFASASDLSSNFGLKTSSQENPVSDLYLYLRDLHAGQ